MTPHLLCSLRPDPTQFTLYLLQHIGMIDLIKSFYKQKTYNFVVNMQLDSPKLLQTIVISE